MIGLTSRRPDISDAYPVASKMKILVSPSYYKQRTRFYSDVPNCQVAPLLLDWKTLNADEIKNLMRIKSGEAMPLYMAAILDMLRKLQKRDVRGDFNSFKAKILELSLSSMQSAPLTLRLGFLESIMQDSEENQGLPKTNLAELFMDPEALIIVDLTDPMLSEEEANGIFNVLFTKFVFLY
jgi:hypothetical protein